MRIWYLVLLFIITLAIVIGLKIFHKSKKLKHKIIINTTKNKINNKTNKYSQCNFSIKLKPSTYDVKVFIKSLGYCNHILRIDVYKSIPATINLLTITNAIGHRYILPQDYENGTTMNFQWPLIGSFIGRIDVVIQDLTNNQTIYDHEFYVNPRYIFPNKTYDIGNTNISMNIRPGILSFNGPIKIDLINGTSMESYPFSCMNLSSIFCPGYIVITMKNNGDNEFSIDIPFRYMVAMNSTLSKFPSEMDGVSHLYFVIEPNKVLLPGKTIKYYTIIYLPMNSRPYLLYFRVIVNGRSYEYNLVFTKRIKNLTNNPINYPFTS